MANVTIVVPDAALPTLRAAAAESGFPNTNAGAKAWVADWVRGRYRAQKHLEAVRSVQATIDTADTAAITDGAGIV